MSASARHPSPTARTPAHPSSSSQAPPASSHAIGELASRVDGLSDTVNSLAAADATLHQRVADKPDCEHQCPREDFFDLIESHLRDPQDQSSELGRAFNEGVEELVDEKVAAGFKQARHDDFKLHDACQRRLARDEGRQQQLGNELEEADDNVERLTRRLDAFTELKVSHAEAETRARIATAEANAVAAAFDRQRAELEAESSRASIRLNNALARRYELGNEAY
ncbi:uncharacterized protein LOC62_02G003502 [Vanrija pseudolonga]|uniref:Uncharacterized protein n=1 Tax=Vanrija pseudolonga TaxID=143232 RepID=A0AAF0Y8Q0_9TREE|nr:hypothetical protein LOC62_02G003502 [Vanrija pseudolonga]